jgi:hypothetical protein
MQSRSWHWQRLTDEQLEAAAVKWVDRAGAHYYSHQGQSCERLDLVVTHILDEMNKRCHTPRLFEVDGFGTLYGAQGAS